MSDEDKRKLLDLADSVHRKNPEMDGVNPPHQKTAAQQAVDDLKELEELQRRVLGRQPTADPIQDMANTARAIRDEMRNGGSPTSKMASGEFDPEPFLRAQREGYEAFKAGKLVEHNPYEPIEHRYIHGNRPEPCLFEYWWQGYRDATKDKMDAEALAFAVFAELFPKVSAQAPADLVRRHQAANTLNQLHGETAASCAEVARIAAEKMLAELRKGS